jgi:hypothetical protein
VTSRSAAVFSASLCGNVAQFAKTDVTHAISVQHQRTPKDHERIHPDEDSQSLCRFRNSP